MTDILKKIIIIGVVLFGMVAIGSALNALVPWIYLGYLFSVIREFAYLFDFMWDVDTTMVLVSLSFLVEVSIWGVRSLVTLIKTSGVNN